MAVYEILSERQVDQGWSFEVQTAADREDQWQRHTLHLSWSDYNQWSVDGGDPPQCVAEAVLGFLLSRVEPQTLPERLDASIARRQFADADHEIPKLIRR